MCALGDKTPATAARCRVFSGYLQASEQVRVVRWRIRSDARREIAAQGKGIWSSTLGENIPPNFLTASYAFGSCPHCVRCLLPSSRFAVNTTHPTYQGGSV